jgi:hypothetical protein
MSSSNNIKQENMSNNNVEIEEEKRKLREEYEEQIKEIKIQYEEEKMSKEALMKKMENIKNQYDSQLVLLNDNGSSQNMISKSSSGRKSGKGFKIKIISSFLFIAF